MITMNWVGFPHINYLWISQSLDRIQKGIIIFLKKWFERAEKSAYTDNLVWVFSNQTPVLPNQSISFADVKAPNFGLNLTIHIQN